MNPHHYQLALQELNQLQKEGLIEPTTSWWACEAFYVNKWAEQVWGKLRLVINYQPLSHFLMDRLPGAARARMTRTTAFTFIFSSRKSSSWLAICSWSWYSPFAVCIPRKYLSGSPILIFFSESIIPCSCTREQSSPFSCHFSPLIPFYAQFSLFPPQQ